MKLLKVFKEAHGRDATDVDELTAWVRSPEGGATPHRDAKGKIIPDEQQPERRRPDAVIAEPL